MKVRIPASLFEQMRTLYNATYYTKINHDAQSMQVDGPYGKYEVVSVPDEEYTENVMKSVRQYKADV
jgi:hypothetical protein